MSEYSKFLNYFNSKKGQAGEKPKAAPTDAETPQDDAAQAAPTAEETAAAETPAETDTTAQTDTAAQTETPAPAEPAVETAKPARKPGRRFIKTGKAKMMSAAEPESDPLPETDVQTYTDRLSAPAEDRTEHTGYTGKINTAAGNSAYDGAEAPETADDTRAFGSVYDDARAARQERYEKEEKTRPIELPGSAPAADDENDAAPTKPLDDARRALLVEIAKSNAEEAGEDPDQLILEGFFNKEEEAEKDEARAEQEIQQELKKTRQKRINDFHFWNKVTPEAGKSPDEAFATGPEKKSLPKRLSNFTEKFEGIDSSFLKINCDEFKDPNDHRFVFKKLMELRRNTLIRALVLAALGLALLIINICAAVTAAGHNGFFTIMGGSRYAYITTNLLILAIASFIVFDDIRNGVISLLQGRPKTDASLAFLLTTAFAQLVASYFTEQNIEHSYHLMTGGVILLCVPLLLAKLFYYDNTRHCFKSIAAKSEKSYLRTLSDSNILSAMLGGTGNDGETVVYAGRTRFIKNFIRRSRSSAAGGQISSRITLITMAASFLFGLISMVAKGNVLWGFSAMCFSAALSFPVGCLFFTGFMIANENRALSVKSSYVRSYSDARDLATVDNIVLRAEDIFSVEITETVCTSGVNRKQAEFCAAVLTDKTGGLLQKAFRNAEGLKSDNRPEVERLTYEDRLGFSAWINDCRVLLGSNTFLVNHNVRMPDESGVLNFIDSDNKPIYLAIEGHFTAMFSAKYSCSSEYVRHLKTLADNGTNILISSSDPNITDAFAEKLLGLPADSVRVISKAAGDKLAVHSNTITDSEDTGIVFTPSVDTLCRCAFSAVKLDKLKKLSKLICEICCCTGVVLSALFAFAGTVSAVAGWLAVLLQLLGMALCFFLPPLLTASSLPSFGKSKVRPIPVNELYTPDNFVPRPKKIEDEEDGEEPAEAEADVPQEEPAAGDEDMKIVPEKGGKRRFRRPAPPAWDDDDDYDDDDDFDIPDRSPGRFAGLMKARFAKTAGQNGGEQAASDELPPEPAAQPSGKRSMLADIPENPDDIHLSTEELLQSSFFQDEENDGPAPETRRAPAPGNEYGEEPLYDDAPAGYDDFDDYEDDDDIFGDGLIGKLRHRAKHGKHGKARYEDPYDDDDFDEPEPEEEEPAPRKRGGRKAVPAAGLSDTVKGLSTRVSALAKNVGKKTDEADDFGDDVPQEEHRFMTSSSPAVAKAQPETPAGRPAAKPSILSFAGDEPAPPHYELGKTDEYDFLNVKFEPPAVKSRDYYNDAYFSRYDTPAPPPAEDDEANGDGGDNEPVPAGAKRPKPFYKK